ncbi:site-specific DNA-methyltransferase [Vibrio alginolyticus]|nr:site-specific DNA-methyltransferase [Vibrio alginolyticus]
MGYSNGFLKAILGNSEKAFETSKSRTSAYRQISKATGIATDQLKYYNDRNIIPVGNDLANICSYYQITEVYLQLQMGIVDHNLIELLQSHAKSIEPILAPLAPRVVEENAPLNLAFSTELGTMYQGDCLQMMAHMESDSVDLVFADPPFNLNKLYPSKMDDSLKEEEYLKWSEMWLKECARILKPGGSLFTWNLPQWNSRFAAFLHNRLSFKHWIATDIKYSLPINGRLYPAHYSLLYFVKGDKANVFSPDRLAAQVCPKCFDDLKDYGGYKHKMNPLGINLSDVWLDIPPVRHAKYKKRAGSNELSIKLLDRIIEMSTNEGDIVFDPFGGSGTTYVVSEIKNRKWIGVELDPCDIIKERFSDLSEEASYLKSIRSNFNQLFPEKTKIQRIKRGLWTSESVRAKKAENTKDDS